MGVNERRAHLAHVELSWEVHDLPRDPFAPIMPLSFPREAAHSAADDPPRVHVTLRAVRAHERLPDPRDAGATPVIFHGATRCFVAGDALVVWDGASRVRVSADGRHLEAEVHPWSLEPERALQFSTITVLMALLLALRTHGLYHLHAAALTLDDGRTVVIAGDSGVGKSTLALALGCAGASFSSDDALLLRARGDTLSVFGHLRQLRMTRQTAAAFPWLTPRLSRIERGSARDFQLDPRQVFPGGVREASEGPFILLFPRVAQTEESQLRELPAAEALGLLLHSCAWIASEHLTNQREQLEVVTRFAASARAYELAAGRRILRDPLAAARELQARLS